MSSFVHWAIAHGVHYGYGDHLRYKLIARRSTFDKLLKEWNKGVVWC